MDKERIKARRERRQQFMRALYEEIDGSVNEFVHGLDIAERLGADPEEGRRIIAYLEEKGLIKVDDHKAGIIRITADGVDAVETE
jgi:Mn-dependent DtxR family transcriptional regulator